MIPLMYSRCLTVKRTYFERSSGLKVDRETRSEVNYFFRSVLERAGEIALEKRKDDIAPSKLHTGITAAAETKVLTHQGAHSKNLFSDIWPLR